METRDDERLRVIVADDDPLVRRLIRDTLQEAGVIVIAEAADGREAVELVRHYRPDVVLMDVVMPGTDGITATKEISRDAPEVRVVMLTTSDDDELVFLGLRAGAAGYLKKDTDIESLPNALADVKAGEGALSRDLTAKLIEHVRRTPEPGRGVRPVRSPLTSREWEVLDLLCDGRTTGQIAEELVLSDDTVRSHVKNAMRKLGVRSRAAAVERAQELRRGMFDDQAR